MYQITNKICEILLKRENTDDNAYAADHKRLSMLGTT